MTIGSAQTNYTGLKGWNDLTPEALDGIDAQALKKSRGKSRPRRVVTPAVGTEPAPIPTSNVIMPGCPPPPVSQRPPTDFSNPPNGLNTDSSNQDRRSEQQVRG